MPTPNTTTYVRPDIGPAFQEIKTEAVEAGFIGLELAPPFPVKVQSGTFPRIPIEAMLEEVETARSAKSGYARGDAEFETDDSFATKEHGAEEPIDERQAAIYADSLDFDLICAARARYKVLNRLEREIKTVVEALGVATAVTVPWSEALAADPVSDVLNELDAFKLGCGHMPDAAWMTDKVLRKLARCASIKDQIKYSGMDDPKLMTDEKKRGAFLQALADLFSVPTILVAGAVRNTANKGQAFSLANVWTDATFGLIKRPTSQDLAEPCALRTFVWEGDGAGIGGVFETYRDETIRSDIMRFRHERQVKTLHSVCVRRLTGVTT
jgi:hypothetical protein